MLRNKKRLIKSASSAPHCLLSRLQGHSFQLVIQLACAAYILQLPSVCVLLAAFKKFSWNKLGILTGTSWHLSNISSDISAPWVHESTSLDINKAKGILTSNPKRIFSDNVTCFGTSKSLIKSASSAPHCLLSRLQGHSFQFVFQLVFLPYTLQIPSFCPADCFQDILLEQAGSSHWNKLAFLQHIKWQICSVGAWK